MESESIRISTAHDNYMYIISKSNGMSMPVFSGSRPINRSEKERAGASLMNAPARGLLRRRVKTW